MKTISIINLKGGVGKTFTAVNMAHILAAYYKKRVLLFDNDKQGNTSKFFGVHDYERKSAADVLTTRGMAIADAIRKTDYDLIDVMPSNMGLLKANLEVMLDTTRPQQTRFRAALDQLDHEYSYCIFDNAPDINMSTINALVASRDVIVPLTIDDFAFDGLAELKEQIDTTRDELNPGLRLAGCVITAYQKNAESAARGEAWLQENTEYPFFAQRIRYSSKANGSIFEKKPICEYSRRSAAAIDYVRWVAEYMQTEE